MIPEKGGGGVVLLGILGEGVPPGFPNPDPTILFSTRFQTRPLKSIPVFKLSL